MNISEINKKRTYYAVIVYDHVLMQKDAFAVKLERKGGIWYLKYENESQSDSMAMVKKLKMKVCEVKEKSRMYCEPDCNFAEMIKLLKPVSDLRTPAPKRDGRRRRDNES